MIQNVKLQLKGNDWIMPTPDFPKTSWYNEVLFGQLASHSSGSRKESGARRGGEGLAQSSRWTPAKPAWSLPWRYGVHGLSQGLATKGLTSFFRRVGWQVRGIAAHACQQFHYQQGPVPGKPCIRARDN